MFFFKFRGVDIVSAEVGGLEFNNLMFKVKFHPISVKVTDTVKE